MHEQHPVFEAPSNLDIPIWRYMNLAKFLSMLQAEALHFARADLLSDELEGSVTKPTLKFRREYMSDMPDDKFEQWSARIAEISTGDRRHNYLNCWHMNEYESAAMWSIYQSGEPQGIAVRSTYRLLSESIKDLRTVYIGTVAYIDFDTEIIPDNNAFYPYVHKRRSFDYEREIRALYPGPRLIGDEDLPTPSGIPIAVDLERLVEAVYLSPKARDWFAELVRNLLIRYGRNWPVHHSDLDADPIF